MLFSKGGQCPALALHGGEPGTRFGHGAQRRFAPFGRKLQVGLKCFHRRAPFVTTLLQLDRGGSRLEDLGLATGAFPFDVGALGVDGVHVPAQAVKPLPLAFEVEAGTFE